MGAASGPTRRRESSRGARARARGGRLGSMSQQRPVRKLPSLLMDPAEETVRRRCRDPINVEGLLVSPRGGLGPGPWGWGVGSGLRLSRLFPSAGKLD